jgi:hypothetical protein
MTTQTTAGCGCPPTAPEVPTVGGIHHVFITALFFADPDGIKLELVHIPG